MFSLSLSVYMSLSHKLQHARFSLEEFLKAGIQVSSVILHYYFFFGPFSIIFSLSLEYVVGFTLAVAVMRFWILDFSPLYYCSCNVSGHSFITCLCFSAVR